MNVLYFIIWICFLIQTIFSHEPLDRTNSPPDLSKVSLACITFPQLIQATAKACMQKENKVLWQKILDCHRPITDQFLRHSAEARCPVPKHVKDPTDTRFSIQKVLFNVCGIAKGNSTQRNEGLTCMINGRMHPFILGHESEVFLVKFLFGKDVPCNIGKCIMRLGLV